MEILEAFALTNSYRAAGELAGCSHHTVEHWVTIRDLGLLPDGIAPLVRVKLIDGFCPRSRNGSNDPTEGTVMSCSTSWSGSPRLDRTTRASRW